MNLLSLIVHGLLQKKHHSIIQAVRYLTLLIHNMTSTELLIQNGITLPQTLSDTIVANTLTTL